MKAQFWSFDIIFAMAIFGVTLVILTYVWFSITQEYSLSLGLGTEEMQAQLQVLQNHILSTGYPSNWYYFVNISDPSTWQNVSIGIGTGKGNNVSVARLMALAAFANYNATTYHVSAQMLGLSYDYFITISNDVINVSLGRNPLSNKAIAIQVASLPVVINGMPANMKIELWTNTSFGVS